MPETPPGGPASPRESPVPAPGDGGTRHALLMLYLAPFLAGAARADWLSIPIFAALFALADVSRTSPALPLSRRLVQAGSVNLLIVTGVFLLGRGLVWSGLIPQAPVELWLTIGMAAVAALILRRIWANRRTARSAAATLSGLTGTGFAPDPVNRHAAVAFELDLFAEAVEARGLTDQALEDLKRALVRLDAEPQVLSVLLSRWRDDPMWQAALYIWLARPFVHPPGVSGPQMADLFLRGMSDKQMQIRAARMALVWAQTLDFGQETAAVRATVAAHLAAPLPLDANARTLRPVLEALDRTLRQP